MIPRATYRLQLHAGFTFADAAGLAPYLARLGVSHVYASPIGVARAGSMHGYDQVDPTRISPELGGEEGFRALVAALRAEGLGVILDIVPNHMAVGRADNRWWLDVLRRGRASEHAELFDIDWSPADPALQGKVLAPFLGVPYGEALASDALALKRDAGTGELQLWAYGEHCFPLRPEDQDFPDDALDTRDEQERRERLHALLERQHFRQAWWRTAGDEINWRRFFDISELAGIKVERPQVFDLVHALPLRLYAEGLIDGVRCDHVDGLADPAAYCMKLREALEAAAARRPPSAPGGPAYLVVEKILAQGERLAPGWRTDGTTGYDYMNEAAALLHDPAGTEPLTALWEALSGRAGDFAREERQARLETLRRSFSGQLEAAVQAFHALARADLATRDLTAGAIRRGLTLLLSVFSAYRTYGVGDGAPASDAPLLAEALEHARPFVAPGEGFVLERLCAWLAGEGPGPVELRRTAVRRLQQLSAPVAAKAVEDTAFYRYGRLLSRDDVGSDPARLAGSPAHMHEANAERARTVPHAMLTTATHDHKRGEDVRARLAVLSVDHQAWSEAVARWRTLGGSILDGVDWADLYPLFQTLVGAWPLDLSPDDAPGLAAFAQRVEGWWRKALREAKLHSSWVDPDEAYEARCIDALQAMLDPAKGTELRSELHAYADRIAPAGAVNGLAQALLRCTAPGVPDLYQGCEFWDLSLVDPDNRRPVDYEARKHMAQENRPFVEQLATWRNGGVKQHVISAALRLRRSRPAIFEGAYTPLDCSPGVFAFLRHAEDAAVLVAAPLHRPPGAVDGRGLGGASPSGATVAIPPAWRGRSARDVLTGESLDLGSLDAALQSAPVLLIALGGAAA